MHAKDQPFGSYSFGTFDSDDDELARLEKQAAIAWPLEKEQLLVAGLKPGMDFLDIACGSGAISACVSQDIIGTVGHVTAVDLNEKLLDVARKRGHQSLNFVQDDAYQLSKIEDGRFDFVYARFLFQHLKDPGLVMRNVLDKLKPGGSFLIADVDDDLISVMPEPDGLQAFMAMARDAQEGYGGDRYIGRKLGGLLCHNGYKDIKSWVSFVTNEMVSLEDFYNITTHFKMELIGSEDKEAAQRYLDQVHAFSAEHPDLFASAGVYFVMGTKPH